MANFSSSSDPAIAQSNSDGVAPAPPVPKLRRNPGARDIPRTYTVRVGDTLWDIAAQYLGTGRRWKDIYDLNQDVIQHEAEKRGELIFPKSWRIWPGVDLLMPGV